MESISAALSKYQTPIVSESKITNNRQFILSQFLEAINNERKYDNWYRYKRALKTLPKLTPEQFKETKDYIKPLTGKMLGIRVAHLKAFDLEYFLSVCKDAKRRYGSFGKCFFGSLKVKSNP